MSLLFGFGTGNDVSTFKKIADSHEKLKTNTILIIYTHQGFFMANSSFNLHVSHSIVTFTASFNTDDINQWSLSPRVCSFYTGYKFPHLYDHISTHEPNSQMWEVKEPNLHHYNSN